MQQRLERGRRCAIADENDVQLRLLVEVHGTVDSSNDPPGVVTKRAAAEERQKHAVVAMASCIHDRRTQRGLIGGLEREPGEEAT